MIDTVAGAETNPDKLRVAFIGSSHVHTPDYLGVCERTTWVEMVGLAEPDPATVHTLPDSLPILGAHGSLPPHDVAVVMTDAASHDTLCPMLAADQLFIEKPLAVNGRRAAALAARLSDGGKHVRSGFFLRLAPALASLENALRAGQIGRILHARFVFAHPGLREGWLHKWPAHLDPDRMGGGAFADLAIHLVDAATRLLGELRPICCQTQGKPLEEGGQAVMEGPAGEAVHIWVSAAAPRVMLDMRLVGEAGELLLNQGRAVLRSGEREIVLHAGAMTTPADGFAAALSAFRAGATSEDLAQAANASAVFERIIEMSA